MRGCMVFLMDVAAASDFHSELPGQKKEGERDDVPYTAVA